MTALNADDVRKWFVVLAAIVTSFAFAARVEQGQATDGNAAAQQATTSAEKNQVEPASFTRSQPERATSISGRRILWPGLRRCGGRASWTRCWRSATRRWTLNSNDAAGYRIKASELWAMGPLVVVFYRGGWCPYCNAHLLEMQHALRAIHAQGGQLVAISPETAEQGLATQARNKLTFPVLSDKGNAVARQFGIVYRVSEPEIPFYDAAFDSKAYNRDRGYELPLAATYVIDTGGVIRYAFLDADFSQRAKPQAVLEALRRLKRNAPEPRPTRPAPVDRTASVR